MTKKKRRKKPTGRTNKVREQIVHDFVEQETLNQTLKAAKEQGGNVRIANAFMANQAWVEQAHAKISVEVRRETIKALAKQPPRLLPGAYLRLKARTEELNQESVELAREYGIVFDAENT